MSNSKLKFRIIIFVSSLLCSSCSVIIPTLIPFHDLPKPTGLNPVGTKVFNWEDKTRKEWFTERKDDYRKIVAQIWYPSDLVGESPMPYLDYAGERIGPISEQVELPKFLIRHIQDVKSNSFSNSPIKKSDKPYPLIIFSHGLGGMRMQNTIQMEELASQGFIILAVDHAYDANITIFSNGNTADYRAKMRSQVQKEEFWAVRLPQIKTRMADLIYIMDNLERLQTRGDSFWKKLDLSRVGVMGHSFGGATAVGVSILDNRFSACVALDGWFEPIEEHILQRGLDIPFLYIGRPHWDNPLNYDNLDKLIINSSVPAEKLLLEGTQHFDYADIPHFTPVASKIGLSGSMPSSELLDTMNTRITSFFKKNLR